METEENFVSECRNIERNGKITTSVGEREETFRTSSIRRVRKSWKIWVIIQLFIQFLAYRLKYPFNLWSIMREKLTVIVDKINSMISFTQNIQLNRNPINSRAFSHAQVHHVVFLHFSFHSFFRSFTHRSFRISEFPMEKNTKKRVKRGELSFSPSNKTCVLSKLTTTTATKKPNTQHVQHV